MRVEQRLRELGLILPDGSLAPPFGRVGADVTPEQATQSARLTLLATLSSLQRAVGDLDRVVWLKVFGMVSSTPDCTQQPSVINGCSDLILELYGPDTGQDARSAVGLAALPFNIPVEIEVEVGLLPARRR
jgi:enamine deaminase RidA (YjgF/YER057c/UK114 family)